jgi:hypothetical protein
MSGQEPQGEPLNVQINVPPDVEAGHFANFAGIWSDQDGFVLDFAVMTGPPQPWTSPETGATALHVTARVVSRVRVPPRQAIELMRALGAQLDEWERNHGPANPASGS